MKGFALGRGRKRTHCHHNTNFRPNQSMKYKVTYYNSQWLSGWSWNVDFVLVCILGVMQIHFSSRHGHHLAPSWNGENILTVLVLNGCCKYIIMLRY